MAVCGTSCDILINNNSAAEAHAFTLNWATSEQDVRTFGSDEFGDWLACAETGTLDIRTYDYIGASVEPGTNATYSANCSSATFAGNCVATTLNIAVDAKGLVEYSHTFRLTGDITITP